MAPRYKTAAHWIYHGETGYVEHTETLELNVVVDEMVPAQINSMEECLNEVMHQYDSEDNEEPSAHADAHSGRSPEAEQFYKLVEDANSELYPGCTAFKKLDFIVELYQTKVLYGWSDKSFSALLAIIKRALPEGETLPSSFYLTKKLINGLGLTYEKIDVYRNDCMLYWPKNSPAFTATVCSVCNESRWEDPVKQIPSNVFRYFPLCPRLQRLYMSKHTSKHMVWHDVDRVKDGVLRHPADSDCWKKLDAQCPVFAADPRNVRLGLATDGFNPFGQLSNSYSACPVVITVYNLPPWMCMKEPYLLMSSLISGPQGPGNDIDVYLQPLMEELKKLWYTGFSTYYVSSDQTFTMRAALMWTINDFPAYANLSGWSTKGKYACPHCNFLTDSFWLKNGHKYCYRRHRRSLPLSHPYRTDRLQFNGVMELDPEPLPPSGSDCLQQLEGLSFTIGKGEASLIFRKNETGPWKKESIFFSLPYWEHNPLRHSFDVMHVEKNVLESVVDTLLGIEGKTNDSLQARQELMGINEHLWLIVEEGRTRSPAADFTITSDDKKQFCKVLAGVRMPDGYASNLSKCVNVQAKKYSGWKNHDCHIVMQELLPLVMRPVLPRHVMNTLHELCKFFNGLCSKTSTPEMFQELNRKIAITLCDMEKIFPPAYFDIMVHLPIHLAYEASIAGPVQYRWMYPIERYLHTLKGYVRNKARPEGSIAEGYIVEECLSFCSLYLDGAETKRTRLGRNAAPTSDESATFSIFTNSGRELGNGNLIELDIDSLNSAHKYVLFNCEEVMPLLGEHFTELKAMNRRKTFMELERMQSDTFFFW